MKLIQKTRTMFPGLLMAIGSMTAPLVADDKKTEVEMNSSSVKKSVTVTSDGNQTIKKTVFTENGKSWTKTEITDANGKTRTIEGDPNDPPNPTLENESKVWVGLKPRVASQALKNQLGLVKNEGLVVEILAPKGPASKAGILVEDLILAVDGKSVGSLVDLDTALNVFKAGEIADFQVMRKGKRGTIKVTIEERPPNQEKEAANDPDTRLDSNTSKDAFEAILSDPNIPESFKESVREMQKRQREFLKKQKVD